MISERKGSGRNAVLYCVLIENIPGEILPYGMETPHTTPNTPSL